MNIHEPELYKPEIIFVYSNSYFITVNAGNFILKLLIENKAAFIKNFFS